MKRTFRLIALLAAAAAGACDSSTDRSVPPDAGSAGQSSGGAGGGGAGAGGETSAGMGGEIPTAGESPGGVGGTGIPCSSDSSQLPGATFTVDLADSDPSHCCGDIPPSVVFHFDQASDGRLELVIGSNGQAFRGAVTPKGSRLVVEPGLPLRDYGNPFGWAMDNGVSIETLTLCFHQAQDSPALLDGRGKVLVVRNSDDYEYQYEASIDFDAARSDTTPPTLPQSVAVDPLDPTDIPVSEPLAPGASATLEGATQAPLTSIEQAATVVAFRPATILPLGLEGYVAASAHDLAGNSLKDACALTTQPDPGIQALDGFESDLRVVNYGGPMAGLVTGARAIEGTQSLEVPGGGVALLHLTRPARSAKHVRFDLLPYPRIVEVPASFVLRAGVVGGSALATREIPVYPANGGAGGESGAGGAAGGREITAVDLELSDAGDDILLEIAAPLIEQAVTTDVSAIVDRLRVE